MTHDSHVVVQTSQGSHTWLLEPFLDRVPVDGLAAPGHAMAAEVFLRPVLTELGASVPTRSLALLDRSHDDPGDRHLMVLEMQIRSRRHGGSMAF